MKRLLFLLLFFLALPVSADSPSRLPITPAAPTVTHIEESMTVQDGGFETGTPNLAWTEASTSFGTPLCTSSCGLSPHSGQWFAWFGGIATATEEATLTQRVVLNSADAQLTFYLRIGGTGTGNLSVQIDDLILATYNTATPGYGDYARVTLPIPDTLRDGRAHILRFRGITYPGTIANFLVDEVTIHSQTSAVMLSGIEANPSTFGIYPLFFSLALFTFVVIYSQKKQRQNDD